MKGRRRVGEPRRWLSWGKHVGLNVGKSALHVPETSRGVRMDEVDDPMLSRKTSSELCAPVPQTDSGDQVENTKAIE